MTARFMAGLAASFLVSGAAALGVSAPVHAAAQGACATTTGVTVVVDFNTLPGGVDVDCVGAGEPAIAQLFAAGHSVEQVQRFPGAICRIDNQPASVSCVNMPPASAYWWLWWSDGKSGEWVYATQGAGSLTVPEGGYVGLVWNADGDEDEPGIVPARRPSSGSSPNPSVKPSPTSSPTKSATTGQEQAPTAASASATAEPSASASSTSSESESAAAENSSPSAQPAESGKPDRQTPSDRATQLPGAASTTVAEQAELDATSATADSGLSGWVPLAMVVILAGVVGIVTVVRRRNLTGGGDRS